MAFQLRFAEIAMTPWMSVGTVPHNAGIDEREGLEGSECALGIDSVGNNIR